MDKMIEWLRQDNADIPEVDVAAIPGVDGDEEHAPDSIEIQDLDNTTDSPIVEAETVEQKAAPVEPAQVAHPSEMTLKLDGRKRSRPQGCKRRRSRGCK